MVGLSFNGETYKDGGENLRLIRNIDYMVNARGDL